MELPRDSPIFYNFLRISRNSHSHQTNCKKIRKIKIVYNYIGILIVNIFFTIFQFFHGVIPECHLTGLY
jgi:hypothetical protein